MTKQEAISAMQAGKKVSHDYFTSDEFITMENGKIVDEKGCLLCPREFWRYRTATIFDAGWRIYGS